MASIDTVAASGIDGARRLSASRGLSVPVTPILIEANEWFGWVERSYPETFPSGPQTQTVTYQGRDFRFRHYPQQNVYLGVTVEFGVAADERVWAMGPFTNQNPKQYGVLRNYACIIHPGSCLDTGLESVSIWGSLGSRSCEASDFPRRELLLRQQLAAKGFTVAAGQCAQSVEIAQLAICGTLDNRVAVFSIPISEFPRALGEGWRPFRDRINGLLESPALPEIFCAN